MGESGYLAAFIAVAAVATFATRVIPFLFFERHTEHPLVRHLGRYLPAAVMALLATDRKPEHSSMTNGATKATPLAPYVPSGSPALAV